MKQQQQQQHQEESKGPSLTFQGALDALKPPGPLFKRTMVMIYADRKIFLLATFHLAMTVVVYGKIMNLLVAGLLVSELLTNI